MQHMWSVLYFSSSSILRTTAVGWSLPATQIQNCQSKKAWKELSWMPWYHGGPSSSLSINNIKRLECCTEAFTPLNAVRFYTQHHMWVASLLSAKRKIRWHIADFNWEAMHLVCHAWDPWGEAAAPLPARTVIGKEASLKETATGASLYGRAWCCFHHEWLRDFKLHACMQSSPLQCMSELLTPLLLPLLLWRIMYVRSEGPRVVAHTAH